MDQPPWIQYLGGTGGLIALVVTIMVGAIGVIVSVLSARRKRTIDWFPISTAAIITTPLKDVSAGLALTYKGVPLESPFSCRLRVENTGRETIRRDQIQTPLKFEFKEAVCYEASITKVSVRNHMAPTEGLFDTPSNSFSVELETHNRNHWIQIDMVADGKEAYPEVSIDFDDASRDMKNGLQWAIRGRRIRLGSAAAIAWAVFYLNDTVADANGWAKNVGTVAKPLYTSSPWWYPPVFVLSGLVGTVCGMGILFASSKKLPEPKIIASTDTKKKSLLRRVVTPSSERGRAKTIERTTYSPPSEGGEDA